MTQEKALPRFVRLALRNQYWSGMLAVSFAAAAPVFAQSNAAGANGSDQPIEQIVITGTRVSARVASDTQTPVDLISKKDLESVGEQQLHSALKVVVPSFSVSAPATAGTLDFTSSPTLRGLGPGDLLLLVNGKRRHSTGALNLNNQIGRGDVGYDFNSLPAAAIGRIEVLRDGASALYGADAVAGVINVVLDKSLGGQITLSHGVTSEGDGKKTDLSAGFGMPLGGDGVIRATLAFQDRERSNRAQPDTRQQYLGSGGTRAISGNYGSGTGLTAASGTPDPREATFNRNSFWLGEAPYDSSSLFLNAEKPLSSGATLYAFGGYSRLSGDSQGFFRRPGDNNTVRAIYPDGFGPVQHSVFENLSYALGLKGDSWAGFSWDLSTSFGESQIDNDMRNSNNASLGVSSPRSAYLGGTRISQWTTNLDLTRDLQLGAGTPARFAMGAEFRKEKFDAVVGEPDSYRNGGIRVLDGPNVGAFTTVGIQPLAGTTPADALKADRQNVSLYAEIEKDLTTNWVATGAARAEHYSDFGDSNTYKLSSRYMVSDRFAVRGSYSTGFKAPNLAQSFTSKTDVTFISGNAVNIRVLPVSDPIARLLGASDLRPAKSDNLSLGFVVNQGAFALTVDAYQILVTDRLALSSTFQDTRITNLLAGLGYPGIGAVSYMTNAIDTTTRGIDLTSSYRHRFADKSVLTLTAAANFNKTSIDRIVDTPKPLSNLGIVTPLYDVTQQIRLTDASPKDKFVLGANWKKDDWTVNMNVARYGEVSAVAFTNLTPAQIAAVTPGYKVKFAPTAPASANSQVIQIFGAKVLTDLSLSYQWGKATAFTFGVNNLFDVYPDKNIASTPATVAAGTNGSDNAGIFPYPYISPFGYTGRSMFAKLDYRF